jgi:outer membrane protein assembly factor BamB
MRLEAVDISAEGKLLWKIGDSGPVWGDDWTFGGPPVTDGTLLYLSALRRGPLRVETHVAALDPLDGRVVWRRLICAAEPYFPDNLMHVVNNLLTVGPGVVYCNTNQGAIAALDARSGATVWLTTYPRTGFGGTDPDRNELHLYRDLNPCLLHQDLVIVAPTDCNRVMALDATTGMLIWATRADVAADAVHLLGVASGEVVVSGECVYWLDAWSGVRVGQFPGSFHPAPGFARPSPRGYGRGVIVGEHVYWPTHDAVLVLKHAAKNSSLGIELVREIALRPLGATGGNIVIAGDVLLIASADHLWALAR